MTELVLSLGGQRATSARAHVPFAGSWVADFDLDEPAALAGAVVAKIGALELRGAVDPDRSGVFGLGARYRVLGGIGWRTVVKERPYQADNGVRRGRVLADLARDVGETITLLAGVDGSLGGYWVRQAAPASRVATQLLGSTPWWVGYDGTTTAGARATAEATGSYELLDYDPRQHTATLAGDDPSAVGVGTVVRDSRLTAPLVVRELVLDVTKGALRVLVHGRALS